MNNNMRKLILLPFLILLIACNAPAGNENTVVSIKTTLGDIRIQLYDSTPIHRDNFIKLVNSKVYDGITFHRVIKEFMIQAGDPKTRKGLTKEVLDTLDAYTLPAELKPEYFHKRGALAAAREGNDVNPLMRSSGTQFYIVQGVKYTEDELKMAEQRINSGIKQAMFNKLVKETSDSALTTGQLLTPGELQEKASIKMFQYLSGSKDFLIPEDQRNVYMNIGGVPRLDGNYTVFGEVLDGMDIVDKIAEVPTDNSDKPLTDIRIINIKIEKK
jgi:cyclophilin family peptidyl-prolyl cis-trans isomerase